MWLLALLMVVWTWGFVNLIPVTALGYIRQRTRITVFHAIANLSACVLLTPRLGPLGLALGALIAMLCTETWMIPLTLYRNAPWAYGKSPNTSVAVVKS
jgi:O-antigen/teichoic acid export membrane protein